MDVSFIIDSLNDAQREAVTASQDPLLVLAGAGSGKTRVLIHRLAWLIQVNHVSPLGILAVLPILLALLRALFLPSSQAANAAGGVVSNARYFWAVSLSGLIASTLCRQKNKAVGFTHGTQQMRAL